MSDARAAYRDTTVAAQRIAGVIAARHRGDLAGAETLLEDLDERSRAAGAVFLADLAVSLLAITEGRGVDDVAAELSLHIAGVPVPRD